MACVRNNRSGCGSCCNNAYARVSCSNCGNRSGCSSCNRNNWINWGNWNHSGCSSCGCCSCHSCSSCNRCNGCSSCSGTCGCSSCSDSWNNGWSGRGCNSYGGGYGLLRGVAGPYNHCANGRRFPFYTGPCGPCADDCCGSECCNECDGCCDACSNCEPCCEDACCCTSSATFTASTPVELAAGDCVELECTSENSNEFTVTRDGVRIHRAGRYMVIYTVHVPAHEAVSSRFILALNGDRIAASAADVTAPADGSTSGYTMHALIHAPADSLLKLVSLGPVSMCHSPASNVFTLSLSRLDG